jgi:acyl carrier protein
VARRISRIMAHFQGIQNIEKMNLNTQWWELGTAQISIGLNELDYVELTVLVENEFKIEFPDDVAEKFKDVNDMVEYVARSFWAV